jgi:hypothetical protein
MSKTAKYSPKEVQDSTRKTQDNPKKRPKTSPKRAPKSVILKTYVIT